MLYTFSLKQFIFSVEKQNLLLSSMQLFDQFLSHLSIKAHKEEREVSV